MGKPHNVEGLKPETATLDAARRIIAVRLAEVDSYAAAVGDPSAATEHHDIRIAAKRLRYTMEAFSFLFPAEFGELIKQVRHIQDLLGRIHDYDVFAPFFEAYLARRRREARGELREVAFGALDRGESAPTLRAFRELFISVDGSEEREALLRLIERTRARRSATFSEFQSYWRQLEEQGFRETLLGMIGLHSWRPSGAASGEHPRQAV